MGRILRGERGRRAWSELPQSRQVRTCARVLVFAGAVGVTWLIGSSTASAYHSTESEASPHRPALQRDVERSGADSGLLGELLQPRACTTSESESGTESDTEPTAKSPSDSSSGSEPSRGRTAPPDETARDGAASTPDKKPEVEPEGAVDVCEDDTETARDPGPNADPDSQALPLFGRTHTTDRGDLPQAGARDVLQPFTLFGDTVSVVEPLANAAGSLAPTKDVTAAAPVNHMVGRVTGSVGDSLLNVTRPVSFTMDDFTGRMSTVLADTTSATGDVTGGMLPRLDMPMNTLVAPPVAGMPWSGVPVSPALPVAPGVGQSNETTSTVGSDDEALPSNATRTGHTARAAKAPAVPAPAPLPAVPGTGVTNGTTSSSFVPTSGGGAIATVPALPVYGAPEWSALLAMAHDTTVRELAGEPAVSPD